MGQSCRCCNSINRLELDRAICRGVSYTVIAREHGVSRDSVAYHAENHLSHQLASAWARKQALESFDLISEIESLLERTKAILTKAEDEEKYGLALGAIQQARGVCELLSRIGISLHEIKLVELQLAREQDGSAQLEREAIRERKLSILSDKELDLLEELMLKVERQDKSMEIAPDPPALDLDLGELWAGEQEIVGRSGDMVRIKPPRNEH